MIMSDLTVSQELLAPSASLKMFGAELLGTVEKLGDTENTHASYDDLSTIIKRHTNLTFDIQVTTGSGPSVFGVGLAFEGHTGTDAGIGEFLNSGGTGGKKHNIVVDLEKGRVSGKVTEYTSVLFLPTSLFSNSDFTPEEITAFLLHEVGHVFFSLATLGDYVRLNYCLTEGIQVLLGKKPNKYKIQLLDRDYLEHVVDDESLAKTLEGDPTEPDLRRAVLLGHEKQRRHQLGSSLGSSRRSEQTADWYVSRIGFSRPLATGLAKITKGVRGNRYYRSTPHHIGLETIKALSVVLGATVCFPVVTIYALLEFKDNYVAGDAQYDNPKQRLEAIRRDMVAQIRLTSPNEALHAKLLEDYNVVDKLITEMKNHYTFTEGLLYLFHPPRRRDFQRLAYETKLEELLNNRLFVQAARFRT